MEFRYRFVRFGTVFQAAEGLRAADAEPSHLHKNEIAVDVGGVCWGYDSDLPVIDHHFQRADQHPSASVAVLHLAHTIYERFSGPQFDTIWLVTHIQPDFDAFCAMYLVRNILERSIALPSGDNGMVPPKFNWRNPALYTVPDANRWPLLLAAYAAHVDNGWRMACPMQRTLHSVLYAALYRGRPYQSETSGAIEIFDEAKHAIQDLCLHPLFDSVLEGSTLFQQELALLDREVALYQRDVHRARKATVHLQEHPGDFRDFFVRVKDRPLLGEDLQLLPPHVPDKPDKPDKTEVRRQADAIYLKDPECLLFKEWARADLDNSPMNQGFTFTAVAYSGGCPGAKPNDTSYFFSLDPEKASGRHLYALWARIQAAEIAAIRDGTHLELIEQLEAAERKEEEEGKSKCRKGYERRAGPDHKALFDDPWFDGDNYNCTLVVTPTRGTLIGPPGKRADLWDDPVVRIVRNELEGSIYNSPLTGFNRTAQGKDTPFDECRPGEKCVAPGIGAYRFASVELNSGVDLFSGHIARQVGEMLWGVLHPELDGHFPEDFLTRHLVIGSEWLGVWSRRGIAVAVKPDETACHHREELKDRFRKLVSLTGNVEAYIESGKNQKAEIVTQGEGIISGASPRPIDRIEPGKMERERIAEQGEELTRAAAHLAYDLTLPESRLLNRFYDALGLRELLDSLRDLNQTAAEKLRQDELIKHTETVARVQTKLEVLEVLICAVYSGEFMHLVREGSSPEVMQRDVLRGALCGALLALLILKPDWKHLLHLWFPDLESRLVDLKQYLSRHRRERKQQAAKGGSE